MIKSIGKFLVLFAFILSALQIQNLSTLIFGESIIRLIAYLTICFVLFGMFFFLKDKGKLPYIIILWFWFFSIYWAFGLLANSIHDNPVSVLKNIIPLGYFLSFSIFLSIKENHKLTGKVIAVTFFISCLLLILFDVLNFDLDRRGIYQFTLERAGGVYADANQAAVVCLLTFIFIKYLFKPVNKLQKILKFLALIITLYAFLLTFSKTGFIVLLVVLGLMYHKWFNPKRLLFTIILIPVFFYLIYNFAIESEFLSVIQKQRIEGLANILTFQYEKVDYSGRDVLLKNMMNYVNENPILGNGINFSTSIRGHNTIIGIWADAGIITFLFFLILLFRHFWISLQSEGENKYFLLSILTVLSVYMLSLQTIINQSYFMVVFVWIGYQMSKEKQINYK
ncbi:O-antigen ligase [uncultured Eudoraea sp.]|uniref:O-antigen ligase family protein n=1 Tax=uncultured Eudoraea sp. TaxID=1035614 RepID=UPI002615DAF9|nr:O-antigen ligase family protein [uncultured Eudoraea sp.]